MIIGTALTRPERVSVFRRVVDEAPIDCADISGILTMLKFDGELSDLSSGYDGTQAWKRDNLPAFTPSGVFTDGRRGRFPTSHSGLVVIDVDDPASAAKPVPASLPWRAHWRTISGGRSILVRVSPVPEYHWQHHQAYHAVRAAVEAAGIRVDMSRDVCRLRYFNFAPELRSRNPLPFKVRYSSPPPPPKPSRSTVFDRASPADLRAALKRIGPVDDYYDWWRVTAAIKHCVGRGAMHERVAHRIWDEWSRLSPAYDETVNELKWAEELREVANPVTLGTIYAMAKGESREF